MCILIYYFLYCFLAFSHFIFLELAIFHCLHMIQLVQNEKGGENILFQTHEIAACHKTNKFRIVDAIRIYCMLRSIVGEQHVFFFFGAAHMLRLHSFLLQKYIAYLKQITISSTLDFRHQIFTCVHCKMFQFLFLVAVVIFFLCVWFHLHCIRDLVAKPIISVKFVHPKSVKIDCKIAHISGVGNFLFREITFRSITLRYRYSMDWVSFFLLWNWPR